MPTTLDECSTDTVSRTDTVRERKKRETRSSLRRAAVALVGERGLHSVTAEEIAAAAGVSPRTFFNYFPTKEDAVVGYDPAKTAEMVERLRSRPDEEPAFEALRVTVLETLMPSDVGPAELLDRLRVVGADPHLVAHQVSRFGDLERALTESLAGRKVADRLPGSHAALVVACVLAAGRVALMSWCRTGGRDRLDRVLADHLGAVGAGLAGVAEPAGSER